MTTLAPAARVRRVRLNAAIFLVAGVLFALIGLLSLVWWFVVIGVLLALAGVYGLRRAGQLQAAMYP